MQSTESNKQDWRENYLSKIDASVMRYKNAIKNFSRKVSVDPINKQDLESFPVLEWKNINESVSVMRRKSRFGEIMSFDTKMEAGSEFGEHFHDDLIESAEVISGEMVDVSENNKVYKSGDIAEYGKGIKHTPIATKETVLHVLFKP